MTKREWMERETAGLLTVENETGNEEATPEWKAAMSRIFFDAFTHSAKLHEMLDKAALYGLELHNKETGGFLK